MSLHDASKMADAYVTVANFIGYAAGVGAGIGGKVGKHLEFNASQAREAIKLIRPLTSAEADFIRFEQGEKLLKEGQIGTIMAE